MSFINDILDSDQLSTVRDFVFSSTYQTMIWCGDGFNGKSILCKTLPSHVFITTNSFDYSSITDYLYEDNSIFIILPFYQKTA